MSGRARQLCTFTLAGQCFGVDVERVQEVMRPQRTTRVPLAPPEVAGLINLRGQIVTALDLRRRLGFDERPERSEPMNVVVRSAGEPVSLLVDQIGDVVDVDDSTFEPPPDTLAASAREMVLGAHKLPDRLLLVLDTDRALGLDSATGSARPDAAVPCPPRGEEV